jgi:hypothetical protein
MGRNPECGAGFGYFVGPPSSERAQQDRADKKECREYRHDVQSLQGKVHERPPSLLDGE